MIELVSSIQIRLCICIYMYSKITVQYKHEIFNVRLQMQICYNHVVIKLQSQMKYYILQL